MASNSSLSMALLIKFSKLFEVDARAPEEIISPFGKTLALKMIGVLNSMLQRELLDPRQQVWSWFGQENALSEHIARLVLIVTKTRF